ncbi:MAG TPA: PilN domain-containing protein [Candidatus Paceibacterota bacterium]|jgi:hypothetical protein
MKTFLTEQYAKAVAREYRGRLVFVASALSCIAFLAAIAFALPTYFLLRAKADAISTPASYPDSLSNVESSAALLKEKISAAETVADEERMAAIVEKILVRAVDGISVTNISLRRDTGASAISLAGVADTREDLVAFQKSLESEPLFSKVVLPVSALAKGKDVHFSFSIDSDF